MDVNSDVELPPATRAQLNETEATLAACPVNYHSSVATEPNIEPHPTKRALLKEIEATLAVCPQHNSIAVDMKPSLESPRVKPIRSDKAVYMPPSVPKYPQCDLSTGDVKSDLELPPPANAPN